jgi:hexosaminidase
LALIGAHINGLLTASGALSIALCGSTIGGPLSVSGSTGFVRIGAGVDDPGVSCGPDSIQGALSLSGNKGGVEVEGARIGGPFSVTNNTAGPTAGADSTAPEIEGNTIGGPLGCSGNTPAPTSDGYPNTASGPKSGQCSVAGM